MIIFRRQDRAFCLDLTTGQLWAGRDRTGPPIHLPPKQWNVLRYLAENPERLITKEELVTKVWDAVPGGVTDDAIYRTISGIRRALGDTNPKDHPHFIETAHGRGFRFIAQIESDESAGDTRAKPSIQLETDEKETLSNLAEEAFQNRSAYEKLNLISGGHSPNAATAQTRIIRIRAELAAYEVGTVYATSYDGAPQSASIADLFMILDNPLESTERRRKIISILFTRFLNQGPDHDHFKEVITQSKRILTCSETLHAAAATTALLRKLRNRLSNGAPVKSIDPLDFAGWLQFVTQLQESKASTERREVNTDKPKIEFVSWHSGSSLSLPRLTSGLPTWVSVRNPPGLVPTTATAIKAHLEFHKIGSETTLIVSEASWYVKNSLPGGDYEEQWCNAVDLDPDDEQSFVLFVNGDDKKQYIHETPDTSVGVIDCGRWEIKLLVTSDNAVGFEGKISFLLTKHRLQHDTPAFTMLRTLQPRSAA